jgi:hypothetical protein
MQHSVDHHFFSKSEQDAMADYFWTSYAYYALHLLSFCRHEPGLRGAPSVSGSDLG